MKLSWSLAVAILCMPLTVWAQAQAPSTEPGKAAPRKEAPKKEAAPREAKKEPAKKQPAKKDAATKAPAKKAAPANAAVPGKTQVSKNVTVYTNTPPPALKDKQGKDIPVTPDAYDVSSALPKKR